MPKDLPLVIQHLRRWRKTNNLSQSQAVRILIESGLPVKLRTLQDWEIGRRSPHPLSAAALGRFLDEHPHIKSSKPRD
jgi:DNA-binding transcriptional regulator YiaG